MQTKGEAKAPRWAVTLAAFEIRAPTSSSLNLDKFAAGLIAIVSSSVKSIGRSFTSRRMTASGSVAPARQHNRPAIVHCPVAAPSLSRRLSCTSVSASPCHRLLGARSEASTMTCICSCVFGCAVFALSGTVVGAFTTQGLPARKYDRDCDQRDERPEGNYERRFQKFTDTVFDFQGCYRPAYAAVQSSTTATRHGLSRSSHQAAFTGCRG